MRGIYKILIACLLTAIVTAFITAFVIKQHYEWSDTIEYLCKDNASPDLNGCCPGEEYVDYTNHEKNTLGISGFMCCPTDGGDCFLPIEK